MNAFFASTRPGKVVNYKGTEFELPILYFRDDLFLLFFAADFGRVKAAMPSDKLNPVRMFGNRALVGFAAFNYIETTIGPYGEVGVVVPAIYGAKSLPLGLSALLESRQPGFGMVVLHLPVTTTQARDGGREGWGYSKFVADMRFVVTPEFMECRLSEVDRHILTMSVAKRGLAIRDSRPLVTFSVKDRNLIKTTIPQTGTYRFSMYPRGSYVQFGDHEVSRSIQELGLSSRPVLSRYYLERSAILPVGEVIEQGVRPLEGYYGQERDGEHAVLYREGSSEAI
ncbi:MAG: acetoacetate decarboxylase family protein [Thermodesulfobacteriota bacterium]